MRLAVPALALLLAAGQPALAQSGTQTGGAMPEALAEAEAAYRAVWEATPFSLRRYGLAAGPTEGYGSFEPRADNVYDPEEPIHVYLEPVAYGWRPEGDLNVFGVTIDLGIRVAGADQLFYQEGFLDVTTASRLRPLEYFGNVTLNLSGLASGDYVLDLTLNDIGSDGAQTISLPITVR